MRALRGAVVLCAECDEPFTRAELTADLKVYRKELLTATGSGTLEDPAVFSMPPKKERIHPGCVSNGFCWTCGEVIYARQTKAGEDEMFGPEHPDGVPYVGEKIHKACRPKAIEKWANIQSLREAQERSQARYGKRGEMHNDIRERTMKGQHVVVLCKDRERKEIAATFYRDRTAKHSPTRGSSISITWSDRTGTCLVLNMTPTALRGRGGIGYVYVTWLVAKDFDDDFIYRELLPCIDGPPPLPRSADDALTILPPPIWIEPE